MGVIRGALFSNISSKKKVNIYDDLDGKAAMVVTHHSGQFTRW